GTPRVGWRRAQTVARPQRRANAQRPASGPGCLSTCSGSGNAGRGGHRTQSFQNRVRPARDRSGADDCRKREGSMSQAAKSLIGKPIERAGGRLKVTGGARYAAEFKTANVAHAALVMSTIANGSIRSIDVKAARSAPGVIEVITHENAPRLRFVERPQTNDDYVAPVFG